MNIKDLLGPLLLAVGLTFLFRSFWSWYQGPQLDVGFVAPLSKVEQEPLYLEVDFEDGQKKQEETLTRLTSSNMMVTFSNHGAIVKELTLIRELDGQKQSFSTIGTPPAMERETEAFLVALDEKTPYYYTVESVDNAGSVKKVIYKAEGHHATVEKTFTIDTEKPYLLDLSVTVTPRSGHTVRPRIIWPSPFLKDIGQDETTGALSMDKAGKFSKTTETKLDPRAGFFAPELFGTDSKYFVNSMIADTNQFARRAYYKSIEKRLLSFLEAAPISETKTWNLSFYVGPKEISTIDHVAPKLEGALDYGFFSPIAKGMLYLLNLCNRYMHNYGFAILFITLLLKLLLMPFTFKGQQKMKKMQDYQKKLAYIQQRYKHDPEALREAQNELIQKHGLPGMGGCLPMFMQIPFFVGLYSALNNSIELYRAPFTFWIQDLSMPDPYYILPVLIGCSAFLGSVAGQGNKADFKQVFVAFIISLFLAGWTASMAAGLALFIFANAFLHFVQTKAQQAIGL